MGVSKREPVAMDEDSGAVQAAVAVTADVALLTVHQGRFSILLVLRSEPPGRGRWELPGSFVREEEDLDTAALRTLEQEAGIEHLPGGVRLEQLRSYGAPHRDPRGRVISVAYVAFAANLPAPRPGRRADEARFRPVRSLAAEPTPRLAFDHAGIVDDAVERAGAKLEYTALATAFLREPFSLSELRAIYEEVWGCTLDQSNFRRKVLQMRGFLTPAGAARASSPCGGRPARLYRPGPRTQLWPPLRRGLTTAGNPPWAAKGG